MLGHSEVVRYLLDGGWIAPQQVVAGDLVVVEATRRHTNYRVMSDGGAAYFVKHGVGAARRADLAAEADLYRCVAADPAVRPLRRYLPRLCHYDPAASVLVLELLHGAQPLGADRQRRGRFGSDTAVEIGVALARLHQMETAGRDLPARPPPAILAVQRPDPGLAAELSQANLQLIATIQQFPAFGQRLDALRATWQPTALVHYDIKGENLLVVPRGAGRRPGLKLVDWEMAGLGDPGWDLGAALAEYLGYWLASIPITGQDAPDRFLELARYPLARIQPAMQRLWQAYVHERGLSATAAAAFLARAVRYSAARLVQTVFEQNQTAAQPLGAAPVTLQLAYNILDRPCDATVHLLGIPWIPVPGW